jgi:hypothetical protein
MDDKPAKEFLDALKQLCKSESMEDTNPGLSTCFEKLLSLLDYIRPQHFVVGVKEGYSLGDIVSVDTTFTVKNNTEITAQVEGVPLLLNAMGGGPVLALVYAPGQTHEAGDIIDMGPNARAFCPERHMFQQGRDKLKSKSNLEIIRKMAIVLFAECYCFSPCDGQCTSIVDDKPRSELKLHLFAREKQEYKQLTSSVFRLALQSVPETTEEKSTNSKSGSNKRVTYNLASMTMPRSTSSSSSSSSSSPPSSPTSSQETKSATKASPGKIPCSFCGNYKTEESRFFFTCPGWRRSS